MIISGQHYSLVLVIFVEVKAYEQSPASIVPALITPVGHYPSFAHTVSHHQGVPLPLFFDKNVCLSNVEDAFLRQNTN